MGGIRTDPRNEIVGKTAQFSALSRRSSKNIKRPVGNKDMNAWEGGRTPRTRIAM